VADGVVRDSASLQADESLLTGESEPVDKRAGDRLLSGSFVVAGSGGYQATGVGAEAYARKLAAQARRFTLVHSELIAGINQILRYVTWAIPPAIHAGDIQPDMPGNHLRGGHHRWPRRCRFTVSHPDHPQHVYGLRINQRSAARDRNHETRRSEAQPL
jgi:E1-E2 ATPase